MAGRKKSASTPTRPRKKRDYKREYVKRIQRGEIRGFSRPQSRGHPRKGEIPLSKISELVRAPDKEQRIIAHRALSEISQDPDAWADALEGYGMERNAAYTLFYSP